MADFSVLIRDFDDIEWRPRSDEMLRADLSDHRPLWNRLANFYERNLSFLDLLPPGRLVLWKLEHWGGSTPYDRVPMSPGVLPNEYAERMLASGHRIVPYTFTERNVRLLKFDLPALAGVEIPVIPIAQKKRAFDPVVLELRSRFGIARSDRLLGVGGQLDPTKGKGLDELVCWFLQGNMDAHTHLLCTVIPSRDEADPDLIRARWQSLAGVRSSERLHIQVSDYGEWPWMCAFYSELDALLVNSVSDSWGRMVSEAMGFGVPALIRRADCATNLIAPGCVLVDGFDGLSTADFESALREARRRAPGIADFVNARYGRSAVARHTIDVLRAYTPPDLLAEFDRLVGLPISMDLLDTLLAK